MNRLKEKANHYSNLKAVIRIATLAVAIWALVIAYQAKQRSEWAVDAKFDRIENAMFKGDTPLNLK